MRKISLDRYLCVQCGQCIDVCPGHLFQRRKQNDYPLCIAGAEEGCIGCNHCVAVCPVGALTVDGVGLDDCLEADKTAIPRFEHIANLTRMRRSIRRFAEKPLEDRIIEQILDVVRWAPSARNGLPVKWIIVNNAEKVKQLSDIVMNWITTLPETERLTEEWKKGGDPVFRGAPCLVGAYTDESAFWAPVDTAIAVETLDLCATAKRLGACWAGYFVRAAQSSVRETINEWLGLSDAETIHGGLMLGHIGEVAYQRIPYRPEAPKKWIR